MAVHAFPDYCELTFAREGGYYWRVLRVHWPKGISRVTIGPGYDMGHRTVSVVKADLLAAGVPSADAAKLAEGAGKTGKAAKEWVEAKQSSLPSISKGNRSGGRIAELFTGMHKIPRAQAAIGL